MGHFNLQILNTLHRHLTNHVPHYIWRAKAHKLKEDKALYLKGKAHKLKICLSLGVVSTSPGCLGAGWWWWRASAWGASRWGRRRRAGRCRGARSPPGTTSGTPAPAPGPPPAQQAKIFKLLVRKNIFMNNCTRHKQRSDKGKNKYPMCHQFLVVHSWQLEVGVIGFTSKLYTMFLIRGRCSQLLKPQSFTLMIISKLKLFSNSNVLVLLGRPCR